MTKKSNTCAVIPFYNEKNTIQEVLDKTLQYVQFVILVDDGSTENYQLNYDEDRVNLIKHNKNRGKGAALKTGLQEAINKKYDYTICLDADLQHPPESISEFIEKLDSADIVVGNRMSDKSSMPFHRIMSNTITSFLLTIKSGIKIPDSQNGFRGYKTSIINNLMNVSDGWAAESEMIILAGRKKYNFDFVTIPTIYANDSSKMQPVKATISFIYVILFK